MNNDPDPAAAWPAEHMDEATVATEATGEHSDGVWQNTIASADHALEEASRIQRGVQQHFKLMQEARALREELRRAHTEIDRYRGMHARVVVGMRQLEEEHAAEMSRLQAENEMLLVRHRVYKLLAEHYGVAALRFDREVFAQHRDRVLEHVFYKRRKGVSLSSITAAEVAFLLL